ncbi:MAG TPA: translation initiation factor IF-2 [Xanthobacteraceae bacterium]|jgi:translation initiation factor IF-2|nr:translation initiation factor IF-2 [Xanthobacteraceae bacterium]
MTETTKNSGEKLSVTPTKTLTLKRTGVEQGVVRQSFSHGRSKQVVVEKVKRRIGPGETKPPEPVAAPPVATKRPGAAPAARPASAAPSAAPAASPKSSGVVLRTLTDDERNARAQALAGAQIRELEERANAEEEAKARRTREEGERSERAAAETRKREEDDRRKHDEETKRKADEVARKRLGDPLVSAKPAARPAQEAEEEEAPRRRGGVGAAARPAVRPVLAPKPQHAGADKRRGRLTVVTAFSADEERERSAAAFRRRERRKTGHRDEEPKEKIAREVIIPETITIQELANRMAERAVEIIRILMQQGHMAKITDTIDADTAQLIAEELGHTVRRVAESDVEEGMFDAPDDPAQIEPRAPVVTIMGHVDHGKTSLLDAIRSTEVAAGEAGGITQHIGAYQVTSPSGGRITFIDTPGHAAFTAMRARGAKITDIVILVVAADDGVMPQTVEAIQHAKAAKVPIIVAVNKIDKADAKPERVRTELLQHEIQVETLGGDVLELEVSAKEKTNLDKLLDIIALQAELLELKANPHRAAEGTVIEARLDRGRGPVATVLVQRGTLKPGDIVVAGSEWGRVRALMSDTGHSVVAAGPSMPVEVLGFNGTPEAGDRLAVVPTEARAREITDYRTRQRRDKMAARQTGMRGSLEQMMSQIKTSGRKEFPLIIKGDVQGSIEAIVGALEKLGTDEVVARVIYSGAGGITESDVTLAASANTAVIGFNVRAHKEAREAAEQAGIEIRYYDIIYNLVDDVKKAMSGLLPPTLRETMLGNATILEVFKVSKVGNVAGCRVTDGTVERGANVRLIRDNVVVHQGKLSQLKRFKDDAREVTAGQECGMAFENYHDMKVGDVIECYRVETVQRTL